MTRLARIATVLAAVAGTALLLSGPATRFAGLPYQVGLVLLLIAALAGVGAVLLAAIGLMSSRSMVLLAALLAGAASAAFPIEFVRQALAVPPINDISTDFANPAVAEQQRKGYPDIQPLVLADAPDNAYARALAAGQVMGWEITKSDAAARRFNAVATSAWFGFSDDVEVRVSPTAQGSRVDVRSKSRVGRSDIGANAKRIRAFTERLK